MLDKIHSVTIQVSDQDAALDYYVNTLGWQKALDNPMGPEMRFLSVVPPGATTQLVLGHSSWFTNETPPPAKSGISLTSSNLDETYATLSARGVTFNGPVEVMPWGQKGVWFKDPFDNEFFVVEE